MTRPIALALALALAGPAVAQDLAPCEDANAAFAPYEGRLTPEEIDFGVSWLQGQLDLRPDNVDPCDLVAGAQAEADAFLAERDSTSAAAESGAAGTAASVVASGPSGVAHAIPAGRSEHRLDLVFDAPASGEYSVEILSSPAWLRIEGAEGAAEAGAERRIAVPFRLAPDALMGETGSVTAQVVGVGGTVGTASFLVRVEAPLEVTLGTPFPNPARGAVTLPFELPAASEVTVEVYDALGRSVARIDMGERAAGAHEAALDGRSLAAGTYVIRMTVEAKGGREVRVRRLTVVR